MNRKEWIIDLRQHYPDDWSWILVALKQDPLVWQCLDNPKTISFLNEQIKTSTKNISPANLALWLLKTGNILQDIQTTNSPQLPASLESKADQAYRFFITHPKESHKNLAFAGAVSLVLREKYNRDDWGPIIESIEVNYELSKSIFACLFGLIQDKQTFIIQLLRKLNSQKSVDLLIHAILSNPLPPSEQEIFFDNITRSFPTERQVKIIQQLENQRPYLSIPLAKNIAANNSYKGGYLVEGSLLFELAKKLSSSEILYQANDFENTILNLNDSLLVIKRLQEHIFYQQANSTDYETFGNEEKYQQAVQSWRNTIRTDPTNPKYLYGLLKLLVNNGQISEAEAWLEVFQGEKDHPLLRIIQAQILIYKGEIKSASEVASSIQISTENLPDNVFEDVMYFLSDFYLNINQPQETIITANRVVTNKPVQPDFLFLLSKAQIKQKQAVSALENSALALAYLDLNEDKKEYKISKNQSRDIFINALQNLEQWDIAGQEWDQTNHSSGKKEIYLCLNQAKNDHLHKNLPKALTYAQKAETLEPENPEVLELLGEIKLSEGELKSSIEYFKKVIQLSPSWDKPWLYLSDAYQRLNQNPKAGECLRTAIISNPDNPEISLAYGKFLINNQAPQEAMHVLQKTFQLSLKEKANQIAINGKGRNSFDNLHLLNRIGIEIAQASKNKGFPGEDVRILRAAIENSTQNLDTNSSIYYAYASSLRNSGKSDESIPVLEQLLLENPDDNELLFELAVSLLDNKSNADSNHEAVQILTKLITDEQFQQKDLAGALLADGLLKSNQYQKAEKQYLAILKSPLSDSPDWQAKLAFGLGKTKLKLKQIEAAIAFLLDALTFDSQNPDIYKWLSDAYLDAELLQESFNAALQVVQLTPNNLDNTLWFADRCLLIRSKQNFDHFQVIPAGISKILKFIQSYSFPAVLWLKMGELHLVEHDIKSALAAFERLLLILDETRQNISEILFFIINAGRLLAAAAYLGESIQFFVRAIEELKKLGRRSSQNGKSILPSVSDLLIELSTISRKSNDLTSAIKSAKEATELEPSNFIGFLRLGDYLFENHQPYECLDCYQIALERKPDDLEIYQKIIYVTSKTGDLHAALETAEKAVAISENLASDENIRIFKYEAAELARSMLLFRRALTYISDLDISSDPYLIEEIICLRAEIELELKDRENALNLSSLLELSLTDHPRVKALKLRLDPENYLYSEDTYLSNPLETLNKYPLSQLTSVDILAEFINIALLRSIAETALEINRWDIALENFKALICQNPHEPYINLEMARFLTVRAESQKFCEALDIVRFSPGKNAINSEFADEFTTVIQTANRRFIDIYQDASEKINTSDFHEGEKNLLYWKDRGNLIFKPNPENFETFKGYEVEEDSFQSLYLAVRALNENSLDITDLLETNPSYKKLLFSAISVENTQPWKALEIIKLAKEKFLEDPNIRDEKKAVLHYLFARYQNNIGNNLEEVLDALNKAIILQPQEPHWRAFAAHLILNEMDEQSSPETIDQAIKQIDTAIELLPENADFYTLKGKIHLKIGKRSEAIEYLEKACKISPELAEPWFILANLYYQNFELDQAAFYADRAVERVDDPVDAILLRGEIALTSGNPRGAQSRAQSILQLIPDHLDALQLLARALNAQGRGEEAVSIMSEIIPQVEKPLPLELERAKWLNQAIPPQEAIFELRMLAERYPREPIIKALLAQVLYENGQVESALQSAHQALQDSEFGLSVEEQSNLHLLLGRHLHKMGQLDGSIHHLNQAIQLQDNEIEAYLELGQTYQDRRQYSQALDFYDKSKHISPKDFRPYLYAGIALKELKDYQKSEEMLRQAVYLAPEEVSIHRQLGAVVALNLVHSRRSANYQS